MPVSLFRRALFVLLLIATVQAASSLPHVHAQPTPPPFDPDTVPPPAQPPIAAFGAALYPENCAPCHGDNGGGDGPTAADLQVKPTAFADPEIMWDLSPAELFHTTKFGRMEALMPPWRNQMSDGEIWDTVYYVWGLHTNQVEIEAGTALYAQDCASCHGETGAGDGPEAEGELVDLSDGAALMRLSAAELDQRWRTAHADLDADYGADYSADERRWVLNAMRTFTYVPPWASPFQAGDGMVEGALVQMTPAGPTPADLPVTLRVFMDFNEVESFETMADDQGAFRFADLATGENMVYAVETVYDGVRYGSDFFRIPVDNPRQLIDVNVFETADDGSGLAIARTNWVIDFEPGAMLIGQIATFGNNLERTFVGTTVEGVDAPVTAALAVPPNAEGISFRDGALGVNYFQVGDTIFDTAPIIPGAETRQIVVSYRVPLQEDGSGSVAQTLLNSVGQMNLLVADLPDLEAEVTGLAFAETDTIQGLDYRIWRGDNLPAGEQIAVQVTGAMVAGDRDPRARAGETASQAAAGPVQTAAPLEPIVPLALGGLLAAALIGAVIWTMRTSDQTSVQDSLTVEKAALIQQIAALDDRHARGELDDVAWATERARLKRHLLDAARLLETSKSG